MSGTTIDAALGEGVVGVARGRAICNLERHGGLHVVDVVRGDHALERRGHQQVDVESSRSAGSISSPASAGIEPRLALLLPAGLDVDAAFGL